MTNRRNPAAAQILQELLNRRAPKKDILRGSLGDGGGTVAHATLADHVYVRLKSNISTVVVARNLAVPVLNNVPVDVERTVDHSQVSYAVIGLTEGITLPVGTQPYANAPQHAAAHDIGGYDQLAYYTRGNFINNPVFVTDADYTMKANDGFIAFSGLSAVRSLYLIDATSQRSGRLLYLRIVGAAGSIAAGVTIRGYGTQTVEGGTGGFTSTRTYTVDNGQLILMSNGFKWYNITSL